jgi:DNA helicase-2/ATP-dependent DNA helicase PcrA
MYASRSRFLPDGILPFFQCRSWPTAERDALSTPKRSREVFDIGARLRARWS